MCFSTPDSDGKIPPKICEAASQSKTTFWGRVTKPERIWSSQLNAIPPRYLTHGGIHVNVEWYRPGDTTKLNTYRTFYVSCRGHNEGSSSVCCLKTTGHRKPTGTDIKMNLILIYPIFRWRTKLCELAYPSQCCAKWSVAPGQDISVTGNKWPAPRPRWLAA